VHAKGEGKGVKVSWVGPHSWGEGEGVRLMGMVEGVNGDSVGGSWLSRLAHPTIADLVVNESQLLGSA
jgi:hypothetical protein